MEEVETVHDDDRSYDKNDSKRQYRKWSLETLNSAISDVNEKRRSLRNAAKHYHIPRQTLHNKLTGKTDLMPRIGKPTVLSEEEETDLVKWAIKMSEIGYGQTKRQILEMVREMIVKEKRSTPFKDNRPGQDWWKGFLKRNPQVKLRTPEPLQLARAMGCTPKILDEWFDHFFHLISELGMLSNCGNRIWNCDESGFAVCPKTGKVLASKSQKNILQITGNSKSQITVLCAISGSGNHIPPFHVYSGTRLTFNPLEAGVEGSRFALSKSGWMNTEIFFGWLANHFLTSIPPARPVVLLLDGHKSHIDLEISRLCERNQIHLYCLPPHSSHIMQPLDVSVFKSVKNNWKISVQQYLTKNPGTTIDKRNFAEVFKACWGMSMSPMTIINGFRSSGIYPVNRNAIDKLKLQPSLIFDKSKEDHLDAQPILRHTHILNEPPNETEIKIRKIFCDLEKSLGEGQIQEYKVMSEEGYDLPDTMFEVWKGLRDICMDISSVENDRCLVDQEFSSSENMDCRNQINEIQIEDNFDDETEIYENDILRWNDEIFHPSLREQTAVSFEPSPKQQLGNVEMTSRKRLHKNVEETSPKRLIFERNFPSNISSDRNVPDIAELPKEKTITEPSQNEIINNVVESENSNKNVEDDDNVVPGCSHWDNAIVHSQENIFDTPALPLNQSQSLISSPPISAFRNILTYPKRIDFNKTTARKVKKTPQHLTSAECMKYFEEEKLQKERIAREKEVKKKLRLEKQREKLLIKKNVKTKRGKRCATCDLLWSKRKKNDEGLKCENCEGWICFTCLKPSEVNCEEFFIKKYFCKNCVPEE